MIRVAAIGDVHFSKDSSGRFREHWGNLHNAADIFLIAGDLTTHGELAQATVLADELEVVQVPTIVVLGNHDYHLEQAEEIREVLTNRGLIVLDGDSITVSLRGGSLGIAGIKGFGGGFPGACCSPFGEPEMKAFIGHTQAMAARLEKSLRRLETDYRIALLHYAPVQETLLGERLEIYPFLGSYLLAQAVDSAGADLVIHGHAHSGQEKGVTPGGIPVRNVALPVLSRAYAVYQLEKIRNVEDDGSGSQVFRFATNVTLNSTEHDERNSATELTTD